MAREDYSGISEQRRAGRKRMDDALSLLFAERHCGAMYMAGYSVECLLKTKLMLRENCDTLEQLEEVLFERHRLRGSETVYSHRLETLLVLTGTRDRLRKTGVNWKFFATVNDWSPSWRYASDDPSAEAAKEFLDAVLATNQWIENNI